MLVVTMVNVFLVIISCIIFIIGIGVVLIFAFLSFNEKNSTVRNVSKVLIFTQGRYRDKFKSFDVESLEC